MTGATVCSIASAKAADPLSSWSARSATWKTRNVTVMPSSPASRSTRKAVDVRSSLKASSRQVTPAMTFDCTVKKQKTLNSRECRAANRGFATSAVANSCTTSPTPTTSAVAANQARATAGLPRLTPVRVRTGTDATGRLSQAARAGDVP